VTNEKIYQLVLKYSYLFDQTPNILDLITVQINKLWDWEYGGRFRRFTNDDDSIFAIMLYLHRKGYSYDQIINKIKNSTVIVLGYDNEERVLETCGDCEGSGREDCTICGGSGTVECNDCDGTGEVSGEACDSCQGGGEFDCDECDGDGYIECRECDGDGDVENPDKTKFTTVTYLTFNPVVANYFRENLNGSIPEIPNSTFDKLHKLDESDFEVELKSNYKRVSNYVIEVTSDPEELIEFISDAKNQIENNYLWTLTE